MGELGRNPARIIPAWQKFLDAHAGRPVRGIGEPIWPGRRPEELLECQLHEALLNVAVDPEIPFWLICPYDAETARLRRRRGGAPQSPGDRGGRVLLGQLALRRSRAHRLDVQRRPLPSPIGVPITDHLHRRQRRAAGVLPPPRAVRRGTTGGQGLPAGRGDPPAGPQQPSPRGAEGTIRIWNAPDAYICEVSDETVVEDLLHGRRIPLGDDHDGLWRANQLCDLVQMRSTPSGTTVRVHAWR